jgi:SAM-dependent methyltransferase
MLGSQSWTSKLMNSRPFRTCLEGKIQTPHFPPVASTVPLSVDPLLVETDPAPEELDAMARRVEATWRRLGETEPHWSVLSANEFRRASIAEHEQSFYQTAEYDVDLLTSALRRCGGRLNRLETCVEYGCGVGRATLGLAPLFKRLVACDISESHLEHARRRLIDSGVRNVELRKVVSPLRPLAGLKYDLFFSRMVLQHNPPPIIVAVLRDALANLRPGGFALFQVPTYGVGYSFRVREYLADPEDGRIEMHCLPQPIIFRLARAAGCEVLEVREDWDTGQRDTYVSNTFVLRMKGE